MFEKYIGPCQFVIRTTIHGRDVCIFGIDTTCLAIYSLNNAGRFSARSAELLRQHIAESRQALGDNAFERSFKLLLLHHHPLPTISSKTEQMLYLKNAGMLLDLLSREDINLILHGHQHDPAYYALKYHLSGDTKSLVVLSAGSATKKLTQDPLGISNNTQLHLIELKGYEMLVKCMAYDCGSKGFVRIRIMEDAIPLPRLRQLKETYTFICRENGDLAARHDIYLSANAHTAGIDKHTICFGSGDCGDPIRGLDRLDFAVNRRDTRVAPDAYRLVTDMSHRKEVEIRLSPPIGMEEELLSCSYTWPKGYLDVISKGRDSGVYEMPVGADFLRITIEVPSRAIKDFRVTYYDESKVVYLPDSPHKKGFEIDKPSANNRVEFVVWT